MNVVGYKYIPLASNGLLEDFIPQEHMTMPVEMQTLYLDRINVDPTEHGFFYWEDIDIAVTYMVSHSLKGNLYRVEGTEAGKNLMQDMKINPDVVLNIS